MKLHFEQSFSLSAENLNSMLKALRGRLKEARIESKTILRIVFTSEEFFLDNLSSGNEGKKAEITLVRKWGKFQLNAACEGTDLPPDESFRLNIIRAMNLRPVYIREKNENKMRFSMPAHRNLVLKLEAAAFACAMAAGFLLRTVLSPEQLNSVEAVLRPLCEKYTVFLASLALPMIFFLILNSISQMGDIVKIRKKMFALFSQTAGIVLLTILCAMAMLLPVFHVEVSPGQEKTFSLPVIEQSILSMIPDNFLSPFLTGNAAQVLFVGILCGFGLIAVRPLSDEIRPLLQTLDALFCRLLEWICTLLPLYIFLNLLCFIFSSHDFATLGKAASGIGIVWAGSVLCGTALLIRLYFKCGISPFRFLRGCSQSLLTAFGTASSTAAYSHSLADMERFGKCDKQLLRALFPLSFIFSKPGSAFVRILYVALAANLAGCGLGAADYPVLILLGWATAISVPPVPGGSIAFIPVLLAQFDIPPTHMALLICVDAATNNIITAYNALSAQTTAFCQAFKSNDSRGEK